MYANKKTYLYHNGNFVKARKHGVSFFSQGLHYGYATFEGIRAYRTKHGTRIFKARAHFQRLLDSAKNLHLEIPYSLKELIDASYKLLEMNGLESAYLRPIIYGDEQMSLQPSSKPNIAILNWRWQSYFEQAQELKVMISSYRRPDPKAFPIVGKVSGLYVNSTLATYEAKQKGYDEALLLDINGNIAQTPGANIFIEKEGSLYTPPRGHIFEGITREVIINMAHQLGIHVEEKHFTPEELKNIDGAFLVGTATEVKLIKSIDGHQVALDYEESLGKILADRYQMRVTREDLHSDTYI